MIIVVYHCFLINEWKHLIKQQINRLITSGLYDACDEFWVTVTLLTESEENFKEFLKEYTKINFEFNVNNTAEYLGIKKVKEIGDKYDDAKILYFHTKGVSNIFLNPHEKNICEEKVMNISAWKECMEYFLIDKWKDSLIKLKDNDCVGVTNVNGWYWGNFWWANSNYIKRCRQVGYWGRWDYEAWLNDYVEGEKKFYQWFNFVFNPYLTKIEDEWYKIDRTPFNKIVLKNAKYGTSPFIIDEGYGDYQTSLLVDVTNHVDELLKKQDYKKFLLYATGFGENDPAPHKRKFLFIEYSLDTKPDKIYKIGLSDGTYFEFEP